MQSIKKWLFVSLLFMSASAMAQQEAMYTQYMFNLSPVNAAAIGRGEYIETMFVSRNQWIGFDGAPNTRSLTADIPVKFFNSGVGFTYVNDVIGPEKSNSLYLDYAYHLKINRQWQLGMGLKGGFKMYSANFSQEDIAEPNDQQFAKDIKGEFMPNFGLGLFLYSKRFYLGLSSPKMVSHKYKGQYGGQAESETATQGGEERHYFVIAGGLVDINREVKFRPSVFTKYVKGAPISWDISANFIFRETFWGGLMFRSGDAIGILAQFQLNNRIRVGYAYDITISRMRKASSNTHEIMISYGFAPNKGKVRSPRYF
jgi:type IX secretion system PorP/SprF family membrane protein